MDYEIWEYERGGSIKTILVSVDALEDSEGIRDFIARPDDIENLRQRDTVCIETDNYLPDYLEG